MKTFEIKITGSGTKEEITKALEDVITSLIDTDESTTFEDSILFTELNEE